MAIKSIKLLATSGYEDDLVKQRKIEFKMDIFRGQKIILREVTGNIEMGMQKIVLSSELLNYSDIWNGEDWKMLIHYNPL